MDPTPLQIREKWLRLTLTMSKNINSPSYIPRDLQNLKKFKIFLSDQLMPAWPGLIGWYGLHSHDTNTYTLVLRFSVSRMRHTTAKAVVKEAHENFHGQVCDEVKVIDYGDASVDMVPRQAESRGGKPFGMLPPELACFYKE